MIVKNLSYLEASRNKSAVALLPIGALEQHGPYLPLGTDAIIAEAVAARVEAKLPRQTLLYPTLVYGCSKEHKNFPGTVYLEYETYTKLLREILTSIFKTGVAKVLIVGGHGGNHLVTQVIQADWNYDHPSQKVYYLFAFTPQAEKLGAKLFGSMESHAGSVETSIIYSLSSSYRKTNKSTVVNRGFVQRPNTSFSTHTSEMLGSHGIVAADPKLVIDVDKGQKIFAQMVKDLVRETRRVAAL